MDKIKKMKKEISKLKKLAYKDLLTGCYNRNWFSEEKKRLEKKYFGLFFLDVNGLKSVNDMLGHNAGDILLKCTVRKIKKILNKQDSYIIRMGGDEFLLLINNTYYVCWKYLLNLKKELNTELSIGYCYYDHIRYRLYETMKIAETGMYQEKKRYYELIKKIS